MKWLMPSLAIQDSAKQMKEIRIAVSRSDAKPCFFICLGKAIQARFIAR